jgi:hypothetical protein
MLLLLLLFDTADDDFAGDTGMSLIAIEVLSFCLI